jgi:hypothetical protein
LEKQAREDFRHNESLMARLVPFLRKEAAKKEAVKKEAPEKEDDNNEEGQQAWPSGSSDDNDPVNPIRFTRVKRWFKCPICVNYLYKHKNGLLFDIESFIKDAMSPPNVVEQYRHLSRLLEATMHDP